MNSGTANVTGTRSPGWSTRVKSSGSRTSSAAKEAMATALKEKMRRAECPNCGWTGHVDPTEDTWLTTCPRCKNPDGDNVNLLPLLHIPYDKNLFTELNLERYELTNTGKLLFNHPEGTHDDRFWSLRKTNIDRKT